MRFVPIHFGGAERSHSARHVETPAEIRERIRVASTWTVTPPHPDANKLNIMADDPQRVPDSEVKGEIDRVFFDRSPVERALFVRNVFLIRDLIPESPVDLVSELTNPESEV